MANTQRRSATLGGMLSAVFVAVTLLNPASAFAQNQTITNAPDYAIEVRVSEAAMQGRYVRKLVVGGEVRTFLGRDHATAVTLGVFYTQDVLGFAVADDVTDARLHPEPHIGGGTDIFLGYRALEIDLTAVDHELDDNLHIGFHRSF